MTNHPRRNLNTAPTSEDAPDSLLGIKDGEVVRTSYLRGIFAAAQPFASLAAFNAAVIPATVTRVSVVAGDVPGVAVRTVAFVRQTGSSYAGLKTGWIPDGEITPDHFGASGNYSPFFDSGFDDFVAFNNAMAYAANNAQKLRGGKIVIYRKHLVDGILELPLDVHFITPDPTTRAINQTSEYSTYPSISTGPAIVGAHAVGPVIRAKIGDVSVVGIELGATAMRRAAPITTGPGRTNCGILVEPADAPGQNTISVDLFGVLCVGQPADGIYMNGEVAQIRLRDNAAINCGRNSVVVDDGALAGRVNRSRPGIIEITGQRGVNLGGHFIAVGHPSSGSVQPYRVKITDCEGFRCGNTPSLLYVSSPSCLIGSEITVINSASSGTSGTSGNVATLEHAWAVAGRTITFIGNRFIQYTKEPMLIFGVPGWSNTGVTVIGSTPSSNVTPKPANFFKVTATIVDFKAWGFGVTGVESFTGPPIDLASLSSGSRGVEVQYEGQVYSLKHNQRRVEANGMRYAAISIADDAVYVIQMVGTQMTGILAVAGSTAARGSAMVHYRCGTAAFAQAMSSAGVTVGVGTAALSGTTGPDGQLNIAAAADGKLYIENRTGATGTFTISFPCQNFTDGEVA